MEKVILITQMLSILMMTGIIWLIQLVQYPFFSKVGNENWLEYHNGHTFWITPIVAPLMIVELVTSFVIFYYPPKDIDFKLLVFGLILTLAVWASTFFLQVPLHEKLAQSFDVQTHALLVNTNWIRTIAWTLHSFLVTYFVWKSLK